MHYDVVVVGSGIAGMTAGITLAKEGRRVLVVEQHATPGGLMRSFRRGRCVFPTGVHSVGALGEGQILWRYLKYLGVLDRVRPVRLDEGASAEYAFPGARILVPSNADAFRDQLIDRFPSERDAVAQFFSDMSETVSHFPLYRLDDRVERPPPGAQAQALGAYLSGLTHSPELRAILSAVNPLYGVDPAECPLYVHFLVLDSFLSSAWRFDEARTPLASAFVEALRVAGAELLCGARVAAIESEGSSVSAVRMADGRRISADVVVFTGHPKQLPGLCGAGTLRPAHKRRLAEQPETPGIFGVAICWEHGECSLSSRDVLVYRGWDTGHPYRQRALRDGELPYLLVCSGSRNPGLQEGAPCRMVSPTETPEGDSPSYSVVALTLTSIEEWEPWWDTRLGSRPSSYRSAKQAFAERVLTVLEETWPGAAGHMRVVDSFSPLTLRDYTLSPRASAYGFRKSVAAGRSGRLVATTRLRGLFLAGQSVVLSGVLGTVISGIDACAAIAGRRHLLARIVRETS